MSSTSPMQESRPGYARNPAAGLDEPSRVARDLHDGVQNELLSLLLRLDLAKEDRSTPPALAATLVELSGHATAALASVREIAHGIYPRQLAKLGVSEALWAQAARAPVDVKVIGSAPRSGDEAEAAVYFCCSEAIQNVAKHAGRTARATVRLHHRRGTLEVRVEDDGRGFDSAQTSDGVGLGNIGARVHTLGGSFKLASSPGHGTAVSMSLPWPPRTSRTDPHTGGRPEAGRFRTLLALLVAASSGILIGQDQLTPVAVAALGLTVFATYLVLGLLAGARPNATVSLAFPRHRGFGRRSVAGYIVAAIIGATLAWLCLSAVSGNVEALAAVFSARGQTLLIVVAVIGVAGAIIATASEAHNVAAIVAARLCGAVALAGLCAVGVGGGSITQLGSLAAAPVPGYWLGHWAHAVGPVAGALIVGTVGFIVTRPGDPGPARRELSDLDTGPNRGSTTGPSKRAATQIGRVRSSDASGSLS